MKNLTPGRIKRLRKKLKLGQERFARIFNVSFTTVAKWENGKSKPSPMAEERLLSIFKKYYPDQEIDMGANLLERAPEETAL